MSKRIAVMVGGVSLGIGVVLASSTALAQPRRAQPVVQSSTTISSAQALTPHTLQTALAAAYANNPALQAARAQLRATDEQVPQALAGWRPTVTVTTSLGYGAGTFFTRTGTPDTGPVGVNNNRDVFSTQATVTQPIYSGGRTRAKTNQAENTVRAQRASLIATEENTFADAVNAYVGVIEAQQLLQLDISNEQVLTRQLEATNDRFRVGEITRTDVAQAQAALAGAVATRETAEGNLQTSNATYQRVIGFPPTNLVDPQPLQLPVKTEVEAARLAAANNPNVISALFTDAAAKDAIDVAFAALAPSVSLQATGFKDNNSTVNHEATEGGEFTANLTVPIYQGGAEYSAVRAARQTEQAQRKTLDNARRTAVQQAVQAWETLVAAQATAQSTRAQISSNQVALEGTEREAIVGSRTTLDVLNAQQALLTSQVTLVQNLASIITASYGVADSIGRLTARDLALNVPLYDDTAYYHAVRNRLWGTGDYATDQPGR